MKRRIYLKMLTILLAVIFACSIGAHLVTTSGAKVKVERVRFDARGAMMDGELFYPHGTNDNDSLPAVIVAHGAGVNAGNMKNFATELARRGFVVLNVNAYGAGISEFPANDEIGMGEKNYNARATPGGLLDAINFVRTLKFVDQTKIGIMGHSQGSRRVSYASSLDCGYLTFNDIMINVMYDVFGIKFTEDEISQNADMLAEKKLNKDQLLHYTMIREAKWKEYDTRIRACLVVGGDAGFIIPQKTVSVGGYKVKRNCQTNVGVIIGLFDSYTKFPSTDTTMASFYTNSPIKQDVWYAVNDIAQTGTILGDFYSLSITSSSALAEAIENRRARFVTMPVETHARNMLSTATTSAAVKFFEQTMGYNCGVLANGATGIDSRNMIFLIREICSGIAMIAMLICLIPFAGLLLTTNYFSICIADNSALVYPETDKKKYWLVNVILIIVGFFAIYKTNSVFAPSLPYWKVFPLTFNWWMPFLYLLWMSGAAIILLTVLILLDKKKGNITHFTALNIKFKFRKVMRTLLLSIILIVSAYLLMSVLVYLFDEDFKFWTVEFTEVKVEFWWIIIKYTVLFLPELLLVGMLTNYTIRKDIPAWKEDLICILCSSIGIYLCWLINYIVLHNGGSAICNWNSSYGMLILIPAITFITRKMYRLTGSVWLAAFTTAFMISWSLACINGYNTYYPQSILSNFFNT